MSIRRDTSNRLMLVRICFTCGKIFTTTADTPFMRQLTNVDGKKQKTCYFCSESCKAATYKHLFDGRAEERRRQREANRDVKEKNRRYYQAHRDDLRAKQRARYWSDPEAARANNRYSRRKRALS